MIFVPQIYQAEEDGLSRSSLLYLQVFLGMSFILGSLAFGCIIVNNPDSCHIARQYLCQGACALLAASMLLCTTIHDYRFASRKFFSNFFLFFFKPFFYTWSLNWRLFCWNFYFKLLYIYSWSLCYFIICCVWWNGILLLGIVWILSWNLQRCDYFVNWITLYGINYLVSSPSLEGISFLVLFTAVLHIKLHSLIHKEIYI